MDAPRRNLTVHKTFKLSAAEWADFRQLIGWRGLNTITDVILAGLKRLSLERRRDLEEVSTAQPAVVPAPPAEVVILSPPRDATLAERGAFHADEGMRRWRPGKCRECGREGTCSPAGLCVTHHLAANSQGKVTTGDKVKAPVNGKSSTRKAKPAERPAGKARVGKKGK